MLPPEIARFESGRGPTVLLIHGSAADRTTWTVPAALLREELTLLAYDRRGAPKFPLLENSAEPSVDDHVTDAVDLIESRKEGAVFVCGSSFGSVIALELSRQKPHLVRGLILCEPPLPKSDHLPAVDPTFHQEFERLIADGRGEDAGEYFLRTVLTDELYERIPDRFQNRSKSMWKQIRSDIHALMGYKVRYATLAEVRPPVLLVGGELSIEEFAQTLDAFARAIPNSRRVTLPGAGHMVHAEAARGFARCVREFVAENE